MKKSLLLLSALLFSFTAMAQVPETSSPDDPPSYTQPQENQTPVYELQPTQLSAEVQEYLHGRVEGFSAYHFDYASLNDYLLKNPYALEFILKSDNGATKFTMQRHDMRALDYTEGVTHEGGESQITFQRTTETDLTYNVPTIKGIVDNNPSILARLAVFDNNLVGIKWNTEGNEVLYYTSLQDFIKLNGDDFVTDENPLLVFNLSNIISTQNSRCVQIQDALQQTSTAQKGYFNECTPRFLTIAAEGDKLWCDQNGSNSANNILQSLFLVECVYTHYFNISFIVKHINLLPNNGTLYNTNNANDLLYKFRDNWNLNHTNKDRDLALLFTGRRPDNGTVGIAFTNSLCNTNWAYAVIGKDPTRTRIIAHEIGHIFGSLHDDEHYGSAPCSGNNIPIMCMYTSSYTPLYFSPHTRSIILNSINNHAYCLNDYANVNNANEVVKSWTNNRNLKWVASWYMQQGDYILTGNFDGENNDEEIFFASPDRNWAGIMDFSCDQGTDWYHLWGNSGNRTFGCWYRNYGDRYYSGDFDGDGKTEILSRTDTGSWAQIKEYLPSSWSWKERWSNNGSNTPIAYWYMGPKDTFLVGDFDGDGKDELLCVNPNGWSHLVKFNSSPGGWYSPQTIWSNNGSGWIGGLQISQIQRYLKGKMRTTTRDELYAFVSNSSSSFSAIMRFNGSGWTLTGGQGLGTSFTTTNVTPAHISYKMMTGNLDNDGYSEYLAISNSWIGSYDYSNGGPGMSFNWSNGGSSWYSDWYLNQPSRQFLVKAAPTAPDQIFNIQYVKRSSGWWFWYREWYEANLAAMYRRELPTKNMKTTEPELDFEKTAIISVNDNMLIYPNPTKDILNIDFNNLEVKQANASLIDITGKTVLQQPLTGPNNVLSLQALSEGVYIIKIDSENQPVITQKIVIQKK